MQVTDTLEPYNRWHRLLFRIALCLLVTAGIAACSEISETQSERVREALSDSLLSTTETWNPDMELIEDTLNKVRLRGEYAATYSFQGKRETRIRGPVDIQVFDSTGAVDIRVQSDRAIYRPEASEFEFFGNVRVRTRSERKMRSEYLKWNRINNSIETPKFVIITTPTDSLAGTGFTSNSDLTDYTIKNPSGRVILN